MSNIQIFEQKDFTGGLNLRSDQYQLADNESPEMLNVEVDPRGGVFSRGGITRLHSAVATADAWDPQRLYGFYSSSANNLMLINGSKIYKQDSAAFTAVAHSGGDIVSTAVHGASCATWGSDLFIVTGASNTVGSYKWTGVGLATNIPANGTGTWQTRSSAVANRMPQAELITVHSNRIFVANTKEDGVLHPNRIRWSDESLPTNWVYEDYIDIEGGGNKITGMCVVNGGLVVFKEYSIYFLYGYDHTDYKIVQVASDIGCSTPHSFVSTQQGVYFYANRKGLHFFDGSNLTNLFEPLRTAFDLRYINTEIPEKVSISWIGRRVWLSLPYSTTTQATTPTINIIYDPTMRSYTMFSTADGYGVIGGIDYRSSEGNELRIACHPITKVVLEVDKYNYDYDAINVDGSIAGFSTVYRTKWFDGGSFLQRKMFRRPDLVMRETDTNEVVTVQVFHDYQELVGSQKRTFNITLNSSAIGMIWGTDNWAYEPAGLPAYGSVWSSEVLGGSIKTASNLGMAKTVQLRFVGELTKPWGINSIGYKWVPRRVKG